MHLIDINFTMFVSQEIQIEGAPHNVAVEWAR